ncbi:MAG: radical SAM protein, partial [Salinibacterium sp.]|nr:radical SAM protein [Salinibacterium sp.]
VGLTVNGKDGKGVGYFESDAGRMRLTPRHFAYLRISEGCNQACAFCTIPSIRGKMRSKPLEAIAAEARELCADGARELCLIGQDTTSYGDDIGQGWNDQTRSGGLPELLRTVCAVADEATRADGLQRWVRLMYAYPSNFRDEFIESFADLCAESCLVPYIDIPLQHASDAMLTAMRRHVGAAQQSELIHKLRERIPGLAVRTTFISGFPGESDEDHQALLDFIEEHAFEAVGVFEYSKEEGTPAGTMEANPELAVPARTKRERKSEIMALQQALAFEQAEFLADQFDPEDPADSGLRLDVLIESAAGVSEDGTPVYKGRAYFQAPQIDSVVLVHSLEKLPIGDFTRCAVVDSDGYDLIAVPEPDLTA